jgi:serine/threonine protein kinase
VIAPRPNRSGKAISNADQGDNPMSASNANGHSFGDEIDVLCDRFEAEWKAGLRPRVETYLAEISESAHPDLLRQLLRVELYYRRADRESPTPEEYEQRFPQHADLVRRVFAEPEPRDSREMPPPSAAAEHPVAATGSHYPAVPDHEILEVLGVGGTAIVYKARNKRLNRLVALKMMRAGDNVGSEEVARFLIEGQAVARLNHPNIVKIYKIGEQDGLPYLSLEFCEAGSLEAKLQGKPLPPQEAAQLVETLARAMHAAHERGIIHRDLKPGNVLLTAAGQPKITDFGLAKKLDAPATWTVSGAVLGTPNYMAPEQAAGKTAQIGPAADIHALGAILYECLTGRPPFGAATAVDTMLQVLFEQPLPPRYFQRSLPRDLEIICLKCLRKEPEQRYESAAALADDLHHFLAGDPIRVRPLTIWEEQHLLYKSKFPVAAFNAVFFFILGWMITLFVVPGLVAFALTLIWFLRPSLWKVVVSSLIVAGATLASFALVKDSIIILATGLAVGMGTAVCIGTTSRVISRYSRRSMLEILPALAMGALVGALVGGAIGHPTSDRVDQPAIKWVDGRWTRIAPPAPSTRSQFYLRMVGTGFLGFASAGLLLAAYHIRRDRRQLRLGPNTYSTGPPRPALLAQSTQRADAVSGLRIAESYPPIGSSEERISLLLRSPPPSVTPLPHDSPAVPGYELLGLLGRGGMGVVYQARHVLLERTVALKVIRAEANPGDAGWERFQVEARAVARLHHPNIVQVYDVGVSNGRPHAALEYVAGGSLAQYLSGQPLSAQHAAQLVETLARAVDTAHRHGILHRDLKPANVLLTPDGQPKITDFGLAKLVDEPTGLTPSDTVLGTPCYMAPEQASGKIREVGPAADIYGLGATLYEVLTGRPPFRAATALETLKQVRLKEPASPRSLQPDVPRTLESICLKCLAKQPRQRYASALELADDLRRFRQGEPTRARPPAVWKHILALKYQYGIGTKQTVSVAEFLAFVVLWLVPLAVFGLVYSTTRNVFPILSMLYWPFIFVPLALRWKKYQSVKAGHLIDSVASGVDLPLWKDGWILVPVSRLRFPPICCDCGTATTETIMDRRFEPLGISPVTIPLCDACQAELRKQKAIAFLFTAFALVFITLLPIVILDDWLTGSTGRNIVCIPCCATPYIALAALIGLSHKRMAPFGVGRYSSENGTIELLFRSAEYAEKFIAGIRTRPPEDAERRGSKGRRPS